MVGKSGDGSVRLIMLCTAEKAMDSGTRYLYPVVVSGSVCLFFIYSGTPVHGIVPVTSKEWVISLYSNLSGNTSINSPRAVSWVIGVMLQ